MTEDGRQNKQKREKEQRWKNKQIRESLIVFDSSGDEGKSNRDLTGGLSRLPLFVTQHAVAM